MPQVLPRRDEGFLGNVLALAKIANPAVSQRADQCLVARHNAAEGIEVACETARDELRVVLFACDYRSVGDHIAGYVPAMGKEVTKNITTTA